MIELDLPPGTLTVLCLGAHPDDIEIGCGGTALALAARGDVSAHHLVLTGTGRRCAEAKVAAESWWGTALSSVECHDLPDGRLPAHWNEVKSVLEEATVRIRPDLVLAPRRDDSHQDHRLLAELTTTVWRDAFVLRYEIPKWDGDLGRVTHHVPLTDEQAHRKVELLDAAYPSQRERDWWDSETFLGLMRLRGIECRARYAEGFVVDKAVIALT